MSGESWDVRGRKQNSCGSVIQRLRNSIDVRGNDGAADLPCLDKNQAKGFPSRRENENFRGLHVRLGRILKAFKMDAIPTLRSIGLLLKKTPLRAVTNQVEVRSRNLPGGLLECGNKVRNSLTVVHTAHGNDCGMLD